MKSKAHDTGLQPVVDPHQLLSGDLTEGTSGQCP